MQHQLPRVTNLRRSLLSIAKLSSSSKHNSVNDTTSLPANTLQYKSRRPPSTHRRKRSVFHRRLSNNNNRETHHETAVSSFSTTFVSASTSPSCLPRLAAFDPFPFLRRPKSSSGTPSSAANHRHHPFPCAATQPWGYHGSFNFYGFHHVCLPSPSCGYWAKYGGRGKGL
ncbi:unnamed protein product [Lathyrus oleraceus]